MTILPESPPNRPRPALNAKILAAFAAGVVVVGGGAAYALGAFGGSTGTTPPSAQPSTAASDLAGLSGAQIVAKAYAAARQAGAVHMDVVDHVASRTVRYSDDAYSSGGVQRIRSGSARAQARVIGATTYFTGNRAAITGFFGMPASSVPGNGRWFRLRPGDAQYKTVTQGITFASSMREIAVTRALTVLPVQDRRGVSVVGVRGQVPAAPSGVKATATLWVAARGPALPVEFDASAGGISMVATFSEWGHARHVAKPRHVRGVPKGAVAASPQADAQMKINLRDLATAEETFLTDAPSSYATATQLEKEEDISSVRLAAGQSIAVHLNGSQGYCLAGLVVSGRYFIYSSEEGGLTGPASSDTCSASLYPTRAGLLRRS